MVALYNKYIRVLTFENLYQAMHNAQQNPMQLVMAAMMCSRMF
jgi:hypothetical protein